MALAPDRLDPVTLSVLASALAGIAEEMGAVLIRGAYSSNIKERRDCSTALFDAHGRMVAQAEHIPVHLGAMPEAVAAVMARDPEPGDVFAINDPFSGGTHLPDITLVSPVAPDGEVLGYAVTRAHHSDVGGMSPGSMPANSRSIFQEGLIIPPLRLVRRGEDVEETLALIEANVRTPDVRRGDLRAQIAPTGSPRRASASSPAASAGRSSWPPSPRSSTTPSAAPARSCASFPTGRRARRARWRATAPPTTTSRCACGSPSPATR